MLILAAIPVLPSLWQAQAAPVSVDTTAWGPMDGFELFGNGLYWWNSGTIPNEVTPARTGQIAVRTLDAGRWLVAKSSKTYLAYQNISLRAWYQSVARNNDYMFYFTGPSGSLRIYRRAIYGSNPPEIDFSGVAFNEAGSILINGSTVYWNVRGGAASNNGELRYKSVEAGPGGGDTIVGSGMGLIKKMKVVTTVDEDGFFFRSYLFMLNTDGNLWYIRLPSLFTPTFGSPTFYTGNVTDFDARTESHTEFVPPFLLKRIYGTRLYATTGVGLGDNRTSGKLFVFNLTSGGTITEYDSGNINVQLTGVAVDPERIFVTSTPLRFDGTPGGFGGWVYDRGNSQLLRKFAPANSDIFMSNPYESIAFFQEGGNLRSDLQWLYYTHQNQVRKIKTDAPAIALDYRAIGLEAVQSVQDYNNSVTLVAGKPTTVRAYAQQLQNTTGIASFPVAGRLRAFRGGVQLPGEAYSYSDPVVDGAADLATLRGNLNRSFLFDLLPEWLNQEGSLQLQFMVNPNGTVPETGDTPFVNNIATATVNVGFKGTPCLIFTVMSSTYPNYDPNGPNSLFGDIMDRALTLLPVPGFKWGIRGGSFTKPVVTLTGIKGRSFTIPSDTSWALTLLSAQQWLTKDPSGCPDTHWIGMFPSAETNFNGLGETPGNTLVIRMGADNSGNWMGPRGGYSLAHELSHNYGRRHIDTPTNCTTQRPDGPYDSYNGGACTLGNSTSLNDPAAPIGYDYRTGTLILPTAAGDLMTYANNRWMSPQTWKRNLDSIPAGSAPGFAPADAPPDRPVLFVQGLLNTAEPSGLLLPVIQGLLTDFDQTKVQSSMAAAAALPATVPHRLRLLNGAANVVLDLAAVTSGFTDEPEEKLKFAQFLPLDPTVVRVQLVSHGVVLAEMAASAHAPAITLAAPVLDTINEAISLTWTASDADNDPLLFVVQFSPDDGVTWQTLRVHDPSLGFTTTTKLLPGGDACRFRVIATDGFNTTMVTTDPFPLGKRGPSITLAGLLDGQRLPFGTALSIRAFAYDAEDGSLDAAGTQWVLSGPQSRTGSGGIFSLNHLAPGAYSLSVSAMDLDGNVGVRSIPFEVLPLSAPDRSAPVLDGLATDAAYVGAPVARLFSDLPEPSVRFVHADGALYVCFSGLPRSDDEANPSDVSFYVNGSGAPAATPQSADQGFGVDENGVRYRSRGNGSGFAAQPPLDFSVEIFQSIGTWGAEFRIPEALLGGWNHDAGLAIAYSRSVCIQIPFIGCVSTPLPATFWPEHVNINQPSSWAPARLGTPLPLANTAPVAVASGPSVVSLNEPQLVTLNAEGSYDLEGNPLTFAWTQTGGPSVSLNDATAASPSFVTPTLTASATVTFQLVVNDGQLSSAPATVTISLVPVAASAGSGGAIKSPVTVNVDGSASVELTWPGAVGETVIIQASTDLIHWEDIATNTVNHLTTVLHLDLQAGTHPYRFYRAVSSDSTGRPSAAGAALEFPGTDALVRVPHAATLDAFPLTVAFWLKTSVSDSEVRGLISKYADSSFNGYSLFLAGGHIHGWYFRDNFSYAWDGALGLDGGAVADDQWHHIALVVDAINARLYVDGVRKSSLAWNGSPGATTSVEPLQFGRYFNYPHGLDGQMDEIALWNRALTEGEINQLVPGKLTGFETGLIGYWSLDEGAGNVANDASASAFPGDLVNGPAWVSSTAPLDSNPFFGNALRFDGVNDTVQVASAPALNTFPLTVTAWIKTTQNSPGYVSVANKYAGGSGNGYSLHLNNGHLAAFYFVGNGTSYIYAGDPGIDGGFIADGQWHHVALVVDNFGGRIYVDDALTGSLGWTGAPGPCTTTTPLRFGLYPLTGQAISFEGRMDNVTLWDRALSASEISIIGRYSITGSESGVIGFWPFDNGTGATATDATGNGYDGVLINGPTWVGSDVPMLP